jgi:hypothetical protein
VIKPSTFCPEECPPDDANAALGKIFRFVQGSPPCRDDMRSWAEQGRSPGHGSECQRCALSVLVDEDDVAKTRKAVPLFRKWNVAVAEFAAGQGKIKQTGNNKWHHSLWVAETIETTVHEQFRVVPV